MICAVYVARSGVYFVDYSSTMCIFVLLASFGGYLGIKFLYTEIPCAGAFSAIWIV